MPTLFAALALLTAAHAAPPPPPAVDLCSGLGQALAAGPDLAAIRRGPGAKPPKSEAWNVKRVWDDPMSITGAQEIRIRQVDDLIAGETYSLTAIFSDRMRDVEALRPLHADLSKQVATCLGEGWSRSEVNLAGTSADVLFIHDKTMVDVTITNEQPDPNAQTTMQRLLQLTSWVQIELHQGQWE